MNAKTLNRTAAALSIGAYRAHRTRIELALIDSLPEQRGELLQKLEVLEATIQFLA